MDLQVRYLLLRDGLQWLGKRRGLERAADGTLSLTRVPAPAIDAAIALDGPFDAAASGIAVYCDDVIVADTDGRTVLYERRDCGSRYSLSIDAMPVGMTVAGDTLFVADGANARILCFVLPSLELRRVFEGGLSQPVGVAVDKDGRVYVVDRGLARVVRFEADGRLDAAYAPQTGTPESLVLADDMLYVSDSSTESVYPIDANGVRGTKLDLSAQSPAVRPRALAAFGNLLLVADAASGTILVFDQRSRQHIGSIPRFRGPVAAMCFDAKGNLLLKTDGGTSYRRLDAAEGCVAKGTIEAGPFDAGELNGWERVVVTLKKSSADVQLSTCTEPDDAAANDWAESPSLDCLIARTRGRDDDLPETRRYLWLRIVVNSNDGWSTSPCVTQAQAQTRGASYLDLLPRIYRRDDRDTRFLERWLALFRSGFEHRERAIESVAQAFDPQMAAAEDLEWLGRVIGFDLPAFQSPSRERAVLKRVPSLYAERGTVAGVRDMAEIYSGIRPRIIEAFQARRVWQLAETPDQEGAASLLGFDTALAASTPEGFVVPRDSRTDPAFAGLRGDYYRGTDFNALIRSTIDQIIGFTQLSVVDEDGSHAPVFTVRWSGQLKPLYSETYLLQVEHGAGTRLWVDGRLLIDSWVMDTASSEARVVLDGDRWHSIQLELRSLTPTTTARLFWSSRRQRREIVPADCLYSLLDEHAALPPAPLAAFDVGHAVVGEGGPLAVSEFGTGLFGDYAHLFTVLAPAGCCDDERRQALRDAIDAEKPAYTDYHLCFVEARMRVGFQARLGIDAIVADGPPPLRLDGTELGRDSYLDDAPGGGGRMGSRARLGQDTVVG
jgi:phage tail-like protein